MKNRICNLKSENLDFDRTFSSRLEPLPCELVGALVVVRETERNLELTHIIDDLLCSAGFLFLVACCFSLFAWF